MHGNPAYGFGLGVGGTDKILARVGRRADYVGLALQVGDGTGVSVGVSVGLAVGGPHGQITNSSRYAHTSRAPAEVAEPVNVTVQPPLPQRFSVCCCQAWQVVNVALHPDPHSRNRMVKILERNRAGEQVPHQHSVAAYCPQYATVAEAEDTQANPWTCKNAGPVNVDVQINSEPSPHVSSFSVMNGHVAPSYNSKYVSPV